MYKQNHEIALWLSGSLIGQYRHPDLLLFIDLIQREFPQEFSDKKLEIFKLFGEITPYEFYYTILNKVQRLSKNTYYSILSELNCPI